MYISDFIRPVIDEKLKELIGKSVTFIDIKLGKITIIPKEIHFKEDDGYCWIEFIDQSGVEYISGGYHGLEIWFKYK